MDKNKYVKELNDLFENRAVAMINESLGRNIAKRNNLKKNDTDLSIDNKLYIDVQYSFNFQKFGDIRIDILSAFYFKNNNTIEESEKLIKKSKENNFYKNMDEFYFIKKYGKYINNDKCDGVLYFFFKEEKPLLDKDPDINLIKNKKISFMCLIPTKIIKKEIEDNWLIMKKKFKINKKAENNIIESHESAFIFINLDYLCKKYNIKKYTSKEEFYLNFRNELNSLYKLNKSPKR